MRRPILLLRLMFLSLALCELCAYGQNSQSYLNDIGSTAYGINIPVENGFINISNGNLHLEFPLASPPQRGALSVSERLVYDSRIWMFSPFGTNTSYHWWPYNIPGTSTTSGGWQFKRGDETGTISYVPTSSVNNGCYNYDDKDWENDYIWTSNVVWTDPNGVAHPSSATVREEENDCTQTDQTTFSPGPMNDGSGYSVSDDGSGNPVVTDSTNNEVYPQVIDRYGNYLSQDAQGNLMDDTGRVPVIVTQNGSSTYYDVLSPNGTIQNNGPRVRYIVTTAPISVTTAFHQSDTYEWTSPNDLNPVQTIQLPDGSQYSFTYDSYGEMSSMTLPTGGVIHYGYGNFFDSSSTENRWLESRQVGSNPAMTFLPQVGTTCANYSNGCTEYINVQKPSGDTAIYELTLANGAWNTAEGIYTGTPPPCHAPIPHCVRNDAQSLVYYTNTYTYSNACSGPGCLGANYITSSLATTELFANGSPSVFTQTQSTFDPSMGKPLTVKTWDYAPASNMNTAAPPSTTPMREVDYTYTGGLPLTVKSLDALGAQAGLTTYAYTSSATATSGLPQHGSQNSGGPYLQSVTRWLNTNPTASPSITYVMDDSGMVTEVDDAKGNATKSSYQCSNSLPYQTTNALQQVTQFGYDCLSAAATGVQDPNDLAAGRPGTTYAYEPVAGRLFTVTRPDGGVTTYSYPSVTEIDTATTASPDPTITSSSILDAFGRQYQQTSGGVLSETTYDVDGRAYCVTNPHSAQPSNTDGSTCTTVYDGLDRPLTIQQADSTTLGISYSSNVVTSSDERGNSWVRTSDALGRLTSVIEPGPDGSITTSYIYDGLGNLLSSIQGVGSATQNRRFFYDSLSRLLWSAVPESGVTCYGTGDGTIGGCQANGYDLNGNLRYRTDANVNVTSNTYDALDRLQGQTRAAVSYGATNVPGSTDLYYYDGQVGQWAVPQFVGGNSIGRLSFTRSFNPDLAGAACDVGGQQRCDDQYYGYDAMGRQNWLVDAPPSLWGHGIAVSAAAYDLAGNMTALQYPTGRVIYNGYDGAGRLSSVSDVGFAFVPSITYAPNGSMQTITFGNGVTETVTENNRLQPCRYSAMLGTATTLMDRGYAYTQDPGSADPCTAPQANNNGNIWHLIDHTSGAPYSQDFQYDTLNRLSSFFASNMANAVRSQSFQYDVYGNMATANGYSSVTPSNAGTPMARALANPGYDLSQGWPFGATNHYLDSTFDCTGADGSSHYDAAGNMLCNGSNAQLNAQRFTWDAAHRMTRYYAQHGGNTYDLTAEYTYDANGNRIRADQFAPGNTPTSWREYTWFNGMMLHDQPNDGQWNDYLYANGRKVARFSTTDTHYYLADHLGATQMELDASGNVTWQGFFAPFGQELDDPSATPMPYRFTGLEADGESGLDHATFRQYAPQVGRWMSPDPYDGSMDFSNPQSLNRYSYVGNMPLGFSDPSGLTPGHDFCGIGKKADGGEGIDSPVGFFECLGELALDIFGITGHPKFTASHVPRPSAAGGDNWLNSDTFAIPYQGLLDPSIAGQGCEFGGCGFTQDGAPGSAINQGLLTSIDQMMLHLPYADPTDINHRLFGTHHCGPGGGGADRGPLDPYCHVHDDCYAQFGVDANVNMPRHHTGLSPVQVQGLARCNQALYDGAGNVRWSLGASLVRAWLKHGVGLGFLYPGTAAQ